jgi:hypothetical protein
MLAHAPLTLNPEPMRSLHPTPYTLHHDPCIPNPEYSEPCTLHHKPKSWVLYPNPPSYDFPAQRDPTPRFGAGACASACTTPHAR